MPYRKLPHWKPSCKQCGRGFRDLWDVGRHMQSKHVLSPGSKRAVVHFGRPRSRISCPMSGCSWRAYYKKNSGSLECHLRLHDAGRVPMYCEICRSTFPNVGEFSTARFGHLLYNRCMAVCCFVSTHYIIRAGATGVLLCFLRLVVAVSEST